MEYVRAVYLQNVSEQNFDSVIDAGFNTAYVNITDRKLIENLAVEFSDHINIVPVVNYIQPNKKLPDDDKFFDGERYLKHIPCPTSINIPRRMLEFPLDLYRKGLCDTVCVNFQGEPNDYHRDWKSESLLCQCERCKNVDYVKQRLNNVELIKDTLNGLKLHSTPYVNPFIWAISEGWLNAYTQKSWRPRKYIGKYISSMENRSIVLKSIAMVKSEDVKRAIKHPLTDGYCVNPKNIGSFKSLNSSVERYRRSLRFKLRRKLTR